MRFLDNEKNLRFLICTYTLAFFSTLLAFMEYVGHLNWQCSEKKLLGTQKHSPKLKRNELGFCPDEHQLSRTLLSKG